MLNIQEIVNRVKEKRIPDLECICKSNFMVEIKFKEITILNFITTSMCTYIESQSSIDDSLDFGNNLIFFDGEENDIIENLNKLISKSVIAYEKIENIEQLYGINLKEKDKGVWLSNTDPRLKIEYTSRGIFFSTEITDSVDYKEYIKHYRKFIEAAKYLDTQLKLVFKEDMDQIKESSSFSM